MVKFKMKQIKQNKKQKDLKYKTNKYIYDFQQSETIRSFGDSICNGKINIDEDERD